MNHSESITKIAVAMAQFQSEPMVIGVNATGYGYDYATLDKAVNRIYPKITALGLSIIQPLGESKDGSPAIHTIVMHESGEWIETVYPISGAGIKSANDAQQFGAAVTYARRYGLLSAFGVPAGKDDDAACLTEKAKAQKEPSGKKYKASDSTPIDDLIGKMALCETKATLDKLMKASAQLIKDSGKREQITAEYQVRCGEIGGE